MSKPRGSGAFVRAELMTTDTAAAAAFYRRVLDLETEPVTLDGGSPYLRLRTAAGLDVGGIYAMPDAARRRGLTPHWRPQVWVPDVVAATAQARDLGAAVLAEPFGLWDQTRLALIHDPTGAPLGLVEGDLPDALLWCELTTGAAGAAAAFYGAMFGWTVGSQDPSGFGYLEFLHGAAPVAGILVPDERFRQVPSHWLPYLPVLDAEAAAAAVLELGGKALGSGLAVDPWGAVFGLHGHAQRP